MLAGLRLASLRLFQNFFLKIVISKESIFSKNEFFSKKKLKNNNFLNFVFQKRYFLSNKSFFLKQKKGFQTKKFYFD